MNNTFPTCPFLRGAPTGVTHLVSPHAVAVEEAHLLVLLAAHVIHTLVRLYIPDLGAERNRTDCEVGSYYKLSYI